MIVDILPLVEDIFQRETRKMNVWVGPFLEVLMVPMKFIYITSDGP